MVESRYNILNGVVSSITSGVSGAILFNWADKAQYKSIKYHRNIFDKRNFKYPMQGTFNSIATKIISNGSYFFWLDTYRVLGKTLYPTTSKPLSEFIAGNLAGSTVAIITNPLSAIKYRGWDKRTPIIMTATIMYKKGGMKSFFKGTTPRICRDMIFSSGYIMTHYYGKEKFGNGKLLFMLDNVSAMVATTLSSPYNYVMNRKYAVKPHNSYPSTYQIFKELYHLTKQESQQVLYLVRRFQIGFGNIRVALGMTISHRIYEYSYNWFLQFQQCQ